MKKIFKLCLLGVLLVMPFHIAFGQETSISGTVTEASGEPLPGVNILVVGTTTGAISDQNGNYSITVPNENAVLSFSFIGYLTQEVSVGNQTSISITLSEDAVGLEELVVIGYGTRKKANLTGAVATVQSEELEKITSVNSTNLLEGQMAGVITKEVSGQPGEDNTRISIRGFGNPLILIDGEERQLSSVDPNMIESISVLKDAAAAIYGARSGNRATRISPSSVFRRTNGTSSSAGTATAVAATSNRMAPRIANSEKRCIQVLL